MHSNSIDNLIKAINLHLYDLDRVINGVLETMPYFDFQKGFEDLINEISKKENMSRRNLDILWEYLFMSEALEFAYEEWDSENCESNLNYEIINSMYVDIFNSCNLKILKYLKTYDKEKLMPLSEDDERSITITPYIKNIEQNQRNWRKHFFEAVS